MDTGTTSSILLRDFVKKGRASGYSGKKTLWKTMGGNFTTKKKALVDFKFPELNIDKMVTWVCHVDESTKKENALYDMIIGVDLMTAIGIYVDTNDKVIRWEGNHTPLGMRGLDQETVNDIYAITQDTPVIQEAEARQSKILDADYSAVDIDDYVDGLTDLTTIEKEQLKTTIVRKVSSTSTVDADKIKLKMALTKWWFKGKLITIKNKDRKEREHLIEEAENALHKMEIKQMA